MLYISLLKPNVCEIIDSKDGVKTSVSTNTINKFKDLMSIGGVNEDGSLTPYNFVENLIDPLEDVLKEAVNDYVRVLGIDAIYSSARDWGIVREIDRIEKDETLIDTDEAIIDFVADRLYGTKISNVLYSIKDSASNVREVNVYDKEAVMDALRNNICFCIHRTSKHELTAYVGTMNIGVVDNLYGKGVIDYIYLHNAYLGYMERMSKLKPNSGNSFSADDNVKYARQHIYSCCVKTDNDGKKVIKKIITSAQYTCMINQLVAMFVLDIDNDFKYKNMFNNICTEMRELKANPTPGIAEVRYNDDIMEMVKKSVDGGSLIIGSAEKLRNFMEIHNMKDNIYEPHLAYAYEKMKKDFDYVMNNRKYGGMFDIGKKGEFSK